MKALWAAMGDSPTTALWAATGEPELVESFYPKNKRPLKLKSCQVGGGEMVEIMW